MRTSLLRRPMPLRRRSVTRIPAMALLILGIVHAGQGTGRFSVAECPFLVVAPEVEGETVVCGRLTVPESRTASSGRTLSLQVAIVRSAAPAAGEPIIYLEGGPGEAAVVAVPDFWTRSALRGRGDVIVFDQRGTGYSEPSLDCTALVDEESEEPVAECRALLSEQGIDLGAFNSRESATDVVDLMDALGIEKASLYGVSYGTRLALTVMRDHPERITSVILDGVYPPHVQGLELQPTFGHRAFEVLFTDCGADRRCAEAFPDLRSAFHEAVDDLDLYPMLDDEGYEITGADLVGTLFELLYDTEALPYLPLLIYTAAEGDSEAFLDLMDSIGETGPSDVEENEAAFEEALDERLMTMLALSTYDDLLDHLDTLDDEEYEDLIARAIGEIDASSDGMFLSVECGEEVPFESLERTYLMTGELDLPEGVAQALLAPVEESLRDCRVWNVPAASAIEDLPVTSDIPTLLLSGRYDPITPPEWGDEAAAYLGTAFHYVFPGMGHGTVDVRECPTNIALAFLENPREAPDASCIETMGPPDFLVR